MKDPSLQFRFGSTDHSRSLLLGKREKKIVQFSGALPAYAPPCFKKKKNLSPYIKRVLKNLKQGAIIVKKFLTIYIFLLLFCLFLDNEPHSVTKRLPPRHYVPFPLSHPRNNLFSEKKVEVFLIFGGKVVGQVSHYLQGFC